MRSHRNLIHLLGIENAEVSPRNEVVALGRGLGMGLSAGGDNGGSSNGTGLYASGKGLSAGCEGCGLTTGGGMSAGGTGLTTGGKLSKIGQAFNKAFNPQKNGVIKVGDKLKTAVVHTYNQAYHDIKPLVNKTISGTENVADKINQGWHKTFNPKTGEAIVSDLKTGARYVIPATTSAIGALAGTALTGGDPLGGIAGSATGAYLGYKADKALGIAGNNDFVGAGVRRRRKSKGKGVKNDTDSSSSSDSESDTDSDSDSESESGKGVRRKRKSKGGTIKDTLDKKVWKKIPKVFHKPLEDIGVASLEYAGFKIPPKKKLIAEDKKLEEGAGFKKGSKSKTRKGELDFMTHKGDKVYHRGGHYEDMPSADGVEGGKLIKHKKGSPEAMEWGRRMKEARMKKKGMTGSGIDNNTPKSNAVRISPYQNF